MARGPFVFAAVGPDATAAKWLAAFAAIAHSGVIVTARGVVTAGSPAPARLGGDAHAHAVRDLAGEQNAPGTTTRLPHAICAAASG